MLQPNIKPDRSIWIVKSRPRFLLLEASWTWAISSTANFSSDHRANLLVLHACFAAAVAEVSWAVGRNGGATYEFIGFPSLQVTKNIWYFSHPSQIYRWSTAKSRQMFWGCHSLYHAVSLNLRGGTQWWKHQMFMLEALATAKTQHFLQLRVISNRKVSPCHMVQHNTAQPEILEEFQGYMFCFNQYFQTKKLQGYSDDPTNTSLWFGQWV